MLDLPPPDPAIEISVASRGMSKGITQSDGPQIVVKPYLQMGPMQAGAQWKNITSSRAKGEASLFVAAAPKLGAVQLNLGVAYKFQTGVDEPTDDKSWEFTGSATRKFGKLSLRANAIYSPDDLGSARRSLFIEAGPTLELPKGFKLSSAIGHRSRVNGVDYTAFNAGVSKTVLKKVTLDARLFGTNRSELGKQYDERAVFSAKVTL